MATALRRTEARSVGSPDRFETLKEQSTPISSKSPYSTFFHRGSISSSDSTNSSPTAPNSETPDTSPDTPGFSQSYSYPSLQSAMRSSEAMQTSVGTEPASPPRKPRNLKNLALNTSYSGHVGRSVFSAALPHESGSMTPLTISAPMTSTFVRPAPNSSSRRKGSAMGLTIQTPTTSEPMTLPDSFPQITPSKGLRTTELRQSQSSSSLPIGSPRMKLQPMRLPSFSSSRLANEETEHDDESNYDAPESREAPPDAYPDGPIRIYEPYVDLYLEPSAQQIADYDVIFNVASEVRNPASHIPSRTLQEASKNPATNGKADQGAGPEYIHIPWEHNTDIVPDLHELVKVVDDRVQSGKKVLIHCQCGVSRSASLIVAYGLYKNPEITVQQAYDAVKQKSRWIGPNMNLIMQLQEFRSGLLTGGRSLGLMTPIGRKQRSATTMDARPNGRPFTAQTAPLVVGIPQKPAPINTNIEHVSPGPASAPVDYNWPKHESKVVESSPASYEVGNADQHTEKKVARQAPPALNLSLANTIVNPDSLAMAPMTDEVDPSFGITSPREEMFAGSALSMFAPPLETPRSTEFGMTPILPKELDDTATLGLTSPREAVFPTQLPQRFPSVSGRDATTQAKDSAPTPSHPKRPSLSKLGSPPSPGHSSASSTRKPSLTLSHPDIPSTQSSIPNKSPQRPRPGRLPLPPITNTANPSIAEALFSPRSDEFSQNLSFPTHVQQNSFPDELMSPRATEFTENPMHDALNLPLRARTRTDSGAGEDPRSPPVRGGHPIARNIDDVL